MLTILKILGALALFMYGMKVMSEGLQKMAGSQLRRVLGAATTNRVTGILTGAFITASIQSSTAATVMTVSFVNAGLLTLFQAITVIMGANIGTTLTAWIMSAGMSFSMATVSWPLLVIAIALTYAKSSAKKSGGEFLFGLAFMFLCLTFLKDNAAALDLGHNEAVKSFIVELNGGWYSTMLFLLVGGVLTFCVQSSAAVMAITMILCGQGALPMDAGIALVMGENIGTTITSNIAALTGNTQARRAAMAHLVFNVFGVIWVLIFFKYFLAMVYGIADYDPAMLPSAGKMSLVLATFHTSFNVCNVLILIWFVQYMEKLVCLIIPTREDGDGEDFKLRFISAGPLSTAELSMLEARKEIHNYAERTLRMYDMLSVLMRTEQMDEFSKTFARIEKYEQISDRMEIEIANYLDNVSDGRLSSETKAKIRAMLREIAEIESIGDSCFHIARTINHKHDSKEEFTESQNQRIEQMMKLTRTSIEHMIKILEGRRGTVDVNLSFNIENEINHYRSQLKSQNVIDISNNEYSYQLGVHYMDIVNECEKLADYVLNVVQSRTEIK